MRFLNLDDMYDVCNTTVFIVCAVLDLDEIGLIFIACFLLLKGTQVSQGQFCQADARRRFGST